MKTRLLILMSMLVAAPAAAQDEELGAEGEAEAEAEMSADVDTETDVEGDTSMGDDSAYASDPMADESTDDSMTVAGSKSQQAYSQRSITIPQGQLRIDLGPADRALLQYSGFAGGIVPTFVRGGGFVVTGYDLGVVSDTAIDLRLGAAFGVIDGLEVGAMVLPLGLAPSGRDTYGDPSVYGRFRILDGGFQLGAQVGLAIPVQDGSDLSLGVSVPIKVLIGDSMALNTGVEFNMTFADPDSIFGINIPLEFAINLTDSIFAGLVTGLNQPNLDVSTTFIPLGIYGGYTLPLGDNMLLDATVDFRLPMLVNTTSGGPSGFDFWQLTVGGVMRMDLL